MSGGGHVLAWSAALAVAMVGLATTAGMLTLFAAPSGAAQQGEILRQRDRTLTWQEANAVGLRTHRTDVICRTPPAATATGLQASLMEIFRRNGAEVGRIEAAAAPEARRFPHTTPVAFRLHARVSPETFLGIIRTLREERPDIILQTFEIVSKDRQVEIMMAGEVVCWDAA